MTDLAVEAMNIRTLICRTILTVYKKYLISENISDVQ